MLELGYVVVADPLSQHCFIEDQHSVQVLDSLREFIAQFVEVEVELLAVEALTDADECLQLRDDHCLLCLPATESWEAALEPPPIRLVSIALDILDSRD